MKKPNNKTLGVIGFGNDGQSAINAIKEIYDYPTFFVGESFNISNDIKSLGTVVLIGNIGIKRDSEAIRKMYNVFEYDFKDINVEIIAITPTEGCLLLQNVFDFYKDLCIIGRAPIVSFNDIIDCGDNTRKTINEIIINEVDEIFNYYDIGGLQQYVYESDLITYCNMALANVTKSLASDISLAV